MENKLDGAVARLAAYALQKGLIEPCEYNWAINSVLDVLGASQYEPPAEGFSGEKLELAPVLEDLLDYASQSGLLEENSVVFRDLLDTEIMGRLTPRPAQVIEKFWALYK